MNQGLIILIEALNSPPHRSTIGWIMGFYPNHVQVPEELKTNDFVLQPLRTDHVKLDYEAVMEDPKTLRAWSQSDWPADDFSLSKNKLDLERHEHEHMQQTAFTYTVLSPSGDHCLGCVYITPLGARIAADHIPEEYFPDPNAFSADVCFWLRPSLRRLGHDFKLLRALQKWFRDEWRFDHIFFHTSQATEHQQQSFEQGGLIEIARFEADDPRPGKWVLYKIPKKLPTTTADGFPEIQQSS
jgi:hypothetical protein